MIQFSAGLFQCGGLYGSFFWAGSWVNGPVSVGNGKGLKDG